MAEKIKIVERERLGLAIIQARKGVGAEAVGGALGLELPEGPGRVGDGRLSAIGTGPGAWFLISEEAADNWAERLATHLEGLATLFDQSAGYIVLRLSGSSARTILQAGAPIDLDRASFGVGTTASTAIAHIVVLLWQVDEDETFDLAFYRSYRESLEHWLHDAVAVI